jgi:hypothetical protein
MAEFHAVGGVERFGAKLRMDKGLGSESNLALTVLIVYGL